MCLKIFSVYSVCMCNFGSNASCGVHVLYLQYECVRMWMCACVSVIECASNNCPSAQQQTQHQQTAFFPPLPLAVNSLHSQDLRATRNESARHKCVMFPPALLFTALSRAFQKSVFVCVLLIHSVFSWNAARVSVNIVYLQRSFAAVNIVR